MEVQALRPTVRELEFAAKLVALTLLIAVLCNGASVYLKRTGLAEADAYRAFWSIHCMVSGPAGAMAPAEPRCCAHSTPEEIARQNSDSRRKLEKAHAGYLYSASGYEVALKLVKDLFVLALAAYSMLLVTRHAAPAPVLRMDWPLYLLPAYAMVAFVASAHFNGMQVAAFGFRGFMFAWIALIVQWLVPQFNLIARILGIALLLEVLLVPLELFHGIHNHGHWSFLFLATRVSGTMILPNSLGIFAVTALAFCYVFSTARGQLPLLCAAALALVILSGSGTGMVCAMLLFIVMLRERLGNDRRAFFAMGGAIAGAIALVMLLPLLTGRELIFNSQWGRLNALASVFVERNFLEIVFGSGLGTGKDAALQLLDHASPHTPDLARRLVARYTDSTVTGLVMEIGVLGAAIFYATLVWAGLRDQRARPFYWVVGLCSLSVNITAFFPINFLLGLAWAHSAIQGRRR